MTGKQSSIIVLGIIVSGIVVYAVVSAFTNSPLPTSDTPPVISCAEQGHDTDPADPTKCISPVATTTSNTTPQVPSPPTPKPNTSGTFDTKLSFVPKQTLTFTDGLRVTLNTINDTRCKPDVQCIWAGELAPEFSVTGGKLGTSISTLNLGTVRSTTTTQGVYSFTLIEATETSVVLNVAVKQPTVTTGGVTGTVTIGPICPVVRIDEPCIVPPEVYTSRSIIVYGPTEDTQISQTKLTADGTFKLSLAPGTYWLQIDPAGIGPGEKKPVTIVANKTSTVDFDIDTGIR